MRIMIAAVALALTACAPQELAAPGPLASPKSYLEAVDLETHTKDDVLSALGPPSETVYKSGKTMWSYRFDDHGARRRYTYIFDGERLSDVRYDAGKRDAHTGLTARDVQN